MHRRVSTYIRTNRCAGLPLQFLLGAQELHPDFFNHQVLQQVSDAHAGRLSTCGFGMQCWVYKRGYTGSKDLVATRASWCWVVYAVNTPTPLLRKEVTMWKRDWESGGILLFFSQGPEKWFESDSSLLKLGKGRKGTV